MAHSSRRWRILALTLLLAMAALLPARAVVGQGGYVMRDVDVLSAYARSTGGLYRLTTIVGEPDQGTQSGGAYVIISEVDDESAGSPDAQQGPNSLYLPVIER